MAAPKITITARYAEGNALGTISLLSLGYGLHQLWIYSVMFGYETMFGLGHSISLISVDISTSPLTVISMFVLAITLIVYAITDQRLLKTFVSKRFMLLAAACMFAGTIIALSATLFGTYRIIAEVIGGILTGWGSASLLICWGTAYAKLDAMSIALNTVLGMLFAVVLYALMLNFLPSALCKLCIALVPIAEAVILWVKTPTPFYERREWPMFDAIPEKKLKFCSLIGISVLLLGFAMGQLRHTSMQTVIPGADEMGCLYIVFCVALAGCITLVITMLTANGDSWSRLMRFLMPVTAIGVLCLASASSSGFEVSSFVLLASYVCSEALLWIFLGELAHYYRLSPILLFSTGRGSLALGSSVALAWPLANEMLGGVSLEAGTIAIVTLSAIIMGSAFFPDEHELAHCVIYRPTGDTILASEVAENDDTPAQADDGDTMASVFGGNESAFVDEADNAAYTADGSEKYAESGETLAPATGDTPPDTAPRGKGKAWFRRNCDMVSKCYMLSNREAEVLQLLAKGFNASAIQGKLFISEGTAKTHIRHIYRKTDVHSQQELIHLVETIDQDDADSWSAQGSSQTPNA